ncbi:MAG: hypothetical protein SGJ11_12230 [Phycisphaerae bacterium]|nr:hypothetical protein [Phycisphaerae bacterium]
MALEPAHGVGAEEAGPARNPWLARGSTGLLRAWFRSVISILGAPTRFISGIPADASLNDAVLFAGVTATLSAVVGAAIVLVAVIGKVIIVGSRGGTATGTVLTQGVLDNVTLAVGNIIVSIVGALVAGFVAHGMLRVLRGAPNGLNRSLQPILYAFGASNAINFVICTCTPVLAPVWWCVAMARMLRVAQSPVLWKTTTASIVAALVWLGASFGGAYLLAFMTGATTAQRMGAAASTASALPRGAALVEGSQPFATPLHALADESLSIAEFLALIAPDGNDFTLAELSRADLEHASSEGFRAAGDRLAAALPANNAPFRLGRAIFLHRDAMTGAAPDSKPWLVIVLPASDSRRTWRVLRPNDLVSFADKSFTKQLERENSRRAAAATPPIPDLTTIPDLLTPPKATSDALQEM